MQCEAVTHPPLPEPPRQLPAVGSVVPDQPSRFVARPDRLVTTGVLNQFWLRQCCGSLMLPRLFQVTPPSVDTCSPAPSYCFSVSQYTLKLMKGCTRLVKSKQGLITQDFSP